MATITYLTGWEHGVLSLSGGGLANDWTNASVSSALSRSGTYAVRLNPTAAVGYWEKAIDGASPTVIVARLYVRYATLPGSNALVFNDDNASTNLGIGYKHADGKFATFLNDIYGTSGGPTVTTDTWYRIDLKLDASTGTATVDAQVDGVALPQSSGAFASAAFNAYKIGSNNSSVTMDLYADDFVASHTSGDYPLGDGYVRGFSPNASGTHNLEASPSSAFFEDSIGEIALQTNETASWATLDDVPLGADEDHVLLENDASLTAAHYAEYAFADCSDSATIQAVRALVTLRQDTAANCVIDARLREGGSDGVIYSGDVNSTFRTYKGATFATKPSGGAWTDSAFDAMTLRYGFTTDADGRVRLDSAMLEAALVPVVGTASVPRILRSNLRW